MTVAENCGDVVGADEPVFRRLEHFKVHEYANQVRAGLASVGWDAEDPSKLFSAASAENRKKRGRPPKYQVLDICVNPTPSASLNPEILLTSFKLPKSSNLQMSKRGRPRTVSSPRHPGPESPDNQSLVVGLPSGLPGYPPILPKPSITPEPQLKPQFDGFATYMPSELCPDPICRHQFQLHFHCRAARCYYSTNKSDQLESHGQDFHESLEIPEGFACFDRAYNCKFTNCSHNENVRHFHCMRTGCGEAFLKVNTLDAHLQIHQISTSSPAEDILKFVKTSGTYFPTSAEHGTALQQQLSITASSTAMPTMFPYTVEQNCGRPFCKLKRRVHYHCSACFQGFSNVGRLLPHLQKHGISLPPAAAAATALVSGAIQGIPFGVGSVPTTTAIEEGMSTSTSDAHSLEEESSPDEIPSKSETDILEDDGKPKQLKKIKFHMFQPQLLKFTTDGRKLFSGEPEAYVGGSSIDNMLEKRKLRKKSQKDDDTPQIRQLKFVDCTQDAAEAVVAASRQEEPAPHGYAKFSSRTDCNFGGCYLKSTAHYHCTQRFCGCAITDKTKIPAHNEIHGKRNEGQSAPAVSAKVQAAKNFRQDVCKVPNCTFERRGNHYHCTKCNFMSSDATKFALHTKQHAKQDQVAALGFEKVSPSSDELCHYDSCPFTAQVHYHCLACSQICLNQLQMTMHKATQHTAE